MGFFISIFSKEGGVKRALFTAVCIFLCSGILRAKAVVELQKSSDGYVVQFEVPQWQVEKVDTLGLAGMTGYGGELFARIRVGDYDFAETVGKPQLPALHFYMALTSLNQAPSFEVLDLMEQSVTLTNRYFPAQTPWVKTQTAAQRRFAIDKEYYASAGQRGPVASVEEVFDIRGVPCALIRVSPFHYNPAENKVVVAKKFTLRILTSTAAKHPGVDSKVFESFLKYVTVNYNSAVEPMSNPGARGDYVIITAPAYESALSEFVNFRKKRFNVKLVTTSQSGTNAADITNYIKGLSPTPSFLLLVGDVADIPSSNSSKVTDLYYSSTTGDYQPEIMTGRFSVTSTTELSNIVAKTIFMETKLGTIAKKILFIGGVDASNGYIAERTHNYVCSSYTVKAGYENIKKYCNTTTVTKSEITTALNSGVIFNVYSGHGSQTSWGAGDFTLSGSDLKSLTNTTSYPFTYGFACLTGTYSNSECYTEACIRAKNGPVIGVGASISTSWGPDDYVERGIFDGLFSTSNPQTSAAASLNAGKMRNTSSKQTYFECYNLMGDPALELMPLNLDPFISLSSPNGGEEWEQGTTQNILWNDNIDGNVKIDLLKGGALKETLAASTQSDGSFEWKIAAGYDPGTDYKIKITSIDSTALFDQSDQNFSITQEYYIVCPYIQTFDTLDTGKTILPQKWEQGAADDFDWLVWKNKTPTKVPEQGAATGPDADHTSGKGNYIYVESSSSPFNGNPGKKVDLSTPKFNYKALNSPKLSFWYHMFSNNSGTDEMGELHLDICVDGTWQNDVFTVSKNQGDAWKEKVVDLNQYNGDRVIFRFRAITGTGWASDVCIDDFKIDATIPIHTAGGMETSSAALTFYNSRIHFQVPHNSGFNAVKIRLFNSQGKLVETVLNRALKAGTHSVRLDTANRNLAAGVYVLTMEAGSYTRAVNIVISK